MSKYKKIVYLSKDKSIKTDKINEEEFNEHNKDKDKIEESFNKYKKKIINLLGNKALDSDKITKICKKLFGSKYKGTFAVDKVKIKSGFFIVNTDKEGEPGVHWIGLGIDKKIAYIYDSFGRTCKRLVPELRLDLLTKGYTIYDNDKKPEQFGNTEICGQLCISWLLCCKDYGIRKTANII